RTGCNVQRGRGCLRPAARRGADVRVAPDHRRAARDRRRGRRPAWDPSRRPGERRVSRAELLAYCTSKPGAWVDEPWEGDQVVKVADKIFAFLGATDGTTIGLKCG